MQKKSYKGRWEKRTLAKSEGVCRFYSRIQSVYADQMVTNPEIDSFRCNVPLEDSDYTTDFVCKKTDGTYRVRECVERKHLTKPATAKLLEMSRQYWTKRGIEDWGLVTNEEAENETE